MCVAFGASIFWFLYEWNALLENQLPHDFSVGRVESNALTSAQKSFIPLELAIKCVGQANIAVKSLWTVRMRTICTKETEEKNEWMKITGKRSFNDRFETSLSVCCFCLCLCSRIALSEWFLKSRMTRTTIDGISYLVKGFRIFQCANWNDEL